MAGGAAPAPRRRVLDVSAWREVVALLGMADDDRLPPTSSWRVAEGGARATARSRLEAVGMVDGDGVVEPLLATAVRAAAVGRPVLELGVIRGSDVRQVRGGLLGPAAGMVATLRDGTAARVEVVAATVADLVASVLRLAGLDGVVAGPGGSVSFEVGDDVLAAAADRPDPFTPELLAALGHGDHPTVSAGLLVSGSRSSAHRLIGVGRATWWLESTGPTARRAVPVGADGVRAALVRGLVAGVAS